MPEHTSQRQGRVLVADNDIIIRGVLRSVLTKIGQAVEDARDSTEALAKAAAAAFDLVILDLDMPGDGGLHVCHALRGMPAYAEVPIVILTALDNPTTRARCGSAGATMFAAKPFTPAELVARLRPFLELAPSDARALAEIIEGDRGIRVQDMAAARRDGPSEADGPRQKPRPGHTDIADCPW